MKTNPRTGLAAFTLIELMVVITIIVILAGLVVAGMGFVNDKQARGKATVQIGMLSQALEKYKLDNSTYPPTSDSAKGEGNSALLFNALYFDGASDASQAKTIYLPELDPVSNRQGWTSGTASATTKIMDPWGKEYRYRTAFAAAVPPAAAVANTNTQNPDFDLWSVGKDGDTNPSTPSDKVNRDDIKNF